MPGCVSVHHMHTHCLGRPKSGSRAPEMNLHMVMSLPMVLGIELVSSGRAANDHNSLHPPRKILLMPVLLLIYFFWENIITFLLHIYVNTYVHI